MAWASRVADTFRKSENSLQVKIHALELELATLTATVEAKQAMFLTLKENDDRAATALEDKMESENSKFEQLSATKRAEISRYESLLNDLGIMHQRAVASLEARIEDFRGKLKAEREAVLEEQRKLSEGRSAIKAEQRSADDTRDEEMEQLAEGVARQQAHIDTLKKEIKDLESAHRAHLNKKSTDHLNETNTLTKNMDADIDVLMAQLRADSRRDEDNKCNEIQKLQDMIRQKERQCVVQGVDPGESVIIVAKEHTTHSGEGGSVAPVPSPKNKDKSSKGKKGDKKGGGGCNQS